MAIDIDFLVESTEAELVGIFKEIDNTSYKNTKKVLNAFKECRVSQRHFYPSNGYGYGDVARDTLEILFSKIMNTEASIIRPQIVSGTHAISLCLFGILRPGDELLSVSGDPYDTLQTVIGNYSKVSGSLCELGISYKKVDLIDKLYFDRENIIKALNNKTKLVMIQRSRGYFERRALFPSEIGEIAHLIKSLKSDVVIMVDNCYGEFVCCDEPSDCIDVDVMAGSLIKNPGGAIAPTGGYVCGKKDIIDLIATRLTAPGLGLELGSYESSYRLFYQGLFMAPHIVAQALKTAVLLSAVFKKLGLLTIPNFNDERSDIVQIVQCKTSDTVKAFCSAVQSASPIDSFVIPEPSEMPGYESQIIMASGAFISGSSIEVSADAPMREPYNVYFQGGISYEHGKYTVKNIILNMIKNGIIY